MSCSHASAPPALAQLVLTQGSSPRARPAGSSSSGMVPAEAGWSGWTEPDFGCHPCEPGVTSGNSFALSCVSASSPLKQCLTHRFLGGSHESCE